jgi:iron complex transport system substrate-binding protein
LTYVKLIFFGKKPETDLADAKYDGKINPLDFIQIKLIIVGKEKELTILDARGRDVTIHKPVNRIVCFHGLEVLRALNAKEKVVGVSSSYVADREVFFPELSKLPNIGIGFTPDYETIFALNPDIVIMMPIGGWFQPDKFVDAGISVAAFKLTTYGKEDPKELSENVTKLGYIVDKEDEAKEFIDFIRDSEAEIYEKVKELVPEEDDRPKVYIEGSRGAYMIGGKNSPMARLCRLAGGRNIGDEMDLAPCPCGKVDPEWVIDQNPDIIFKVKLMGAPHARLPIGYETDDPSGMKELRDEIMNRPELANVKAVKNGQVYVMTCFGQTPASCIGIPYMAKAIYPYIFSELDPKEIHQQYLTKFQGLDYDLDEQGVFIYHPVYFPEGR